MLSVVWLAFVGIMVAAAVIDLISYRIPNLLVIALLALFVVIAALHWNEVSWVSHLSAAILVFGAGIFLYAMRQMGAGDVKLLAVVALWSGVFSLAPLMLYVSLCGLAGMFAILIARPIARRFAADRSPERRPLPRVLQKGQGIPYAIGIAPGAIMASFGFVPWLWTV